MQDHRVVEWVAHGLNLPQYAAAFKRNAITALDFPLLVADGGATLQQELGVASKLHREQVGLWDVGAEHSRHKSTCCKGCCCLQPAGAILAIAI